MIIFRSLLFQLGMLLLTVFYGVLGLFTFPLPHIFRYRFFSGWAIGILFLLKWVCHLDYKITGLENLFQQNSCVLYSKHQSAWETISAITFLPIHTWVVKKELLRIPFFGWALKLLNCIAIDRDGGRSALKKLIHEGTEALRRGHHVLIYPEGTRVAVGEEREYQIGGAMLAVKAGVPVVPIAHNAGSFWKKHGFLIRPGTIEVMIGVPIQTEHLQARELNALAKQWIDEAMNQIQSRQSAKIGITNQK
ncbi:MAG TPA: 1-acyl-sn-glycerol-3-phosphate acyltransferase [Gammaproteobacteria bacterium]|nr:1-acyl-sn-glycerol-3-phosphate acyltransferase [Gammaproteobacteria bacterium]